MFCDVKSDYYLLRLKEKYYPYEDILLNKRSELISKCRLKNRNIMLANTGNIENRNNDTMD